MTKRRHRRAGWEAARLGRCADGRRLTARPKVRGGVRPRQLVWVRLAGSVVGPLGPGDRPWPIILDDE
jgi:hypothetical protein